MSIKRIDEVIERGIAEWRFPGAVCVVARGKEIVHRKAYGSTMYDDPDSKPVTLDTIYDIASITKVFTATALLRLVDQGVMNLEDRLARYFPEFATPTKRRITIRDLLSHRAGLDLVSSSLRTLPAKTIREDMLRAEPNPKIAGWDWYTNINFAILGFLIEKVAEQLLDRAMHELVLEPLGLSNTLYRPPKALRPRIAPSENDRTWRKKLLWGEVNDDSGWALGGTAGHAGLFSTAADLLTFGRTWLEGGRFRGKKFLSKELVEQATKRVSEVHPSNSFFYPGFHGLGWRIDLRVAPKDSYGHGGFTGPLLQLFPKRRTILVFLTNLQYPRRDKTKSLTSIWESLVDSLAVE